MDANTKQLLVYVMSDMAYNLREETLDEDRHLIGGETNKEVTIFDKKYIIKISAFWEKCFHWDFIIECGRDMWTGMADDCGTLRFERNYDAKI